MQMVWRIQNVKLIILISSTDKSTDKSKCDIFKFVNKVAELRRINEKYMSK